MSELAFNLNGERFDLPDNAAGWRVRRLKAGGRGILFMRVFMDVVAWSAPSNGGTVVPMLKKL